MQTLHTQTHLHIHLVHVSILICDASTMLYTLIYNLVLQLHQKDRIITSGVFVIDSVFSSSPCNEANEIPFCLSEIVFMSPDLLLIG